MANTTNKQLENQLHRIKGQIDGIERMLFECRSCSDIVMQLMAARASLEQCTLRLLEDETRACAGSKSKSEQLRIQKLASTLFKYT